MYINPVIRYVNFLHVRVQCLVPNTDLQMCQTRCHLATNLVLSDHLSPQCAEMLLKQNIITWNYYNELRYFTPTYAVVFRSSDEVRTDADCLYSSSRLCSLRGWKKAMVGRLNILHNAILRNILMKDHLSEMSLLSPHFEQIFRESEHEGQTML